MEMLNICRCMLCYYVNLFSDASETVHKHNSERQYINIYKLFSISLIMSFSVGIGSTIENVNAPDTVSVGNYSLLRNLHLADRVKIWHFCNLYGCKIGANTTIGSYTQIGAESVVGEYCRIHDGVSIP